MSLYAGTFKLVSRGMDGYDLVFDRFNAFNGPEEMWPVGSLADAVGVVQGLIGRPLTAGEQETLAIGNGLVVS